jgi:uncharacterized protein (TIGR00251 family)
MFTLRAVDDGVEFFVHVQPKASRNSIVGQHGDRLKIAVTAPPTDGKANRAIVDLVADAFHVRRATVEVAAGHGSRDKTIRIHGLKSRDASKRLAYLLAGMKRRRRKV